MPFETSLKVVNIEITSYCNLSCMYCSKDKFDSNRKLFDSMTIGEFSNILDMFPNKNILLALYLSGEPLTHPEFIDFVKLANDKGFKNTRIHTNGTLLNYRMSKRIADSGLKSIVFSIDGRDAKDYERIRSYSFERIKKNLYDFALANSKQVEIGVQCLVPEGTPLELNKDLEDLRDYIDFTIVGHPHNWLYGPEAIPESKSETVTKIPCLFLQNYMTIAVDGDYLLCCKCLNKERVLGNVKNRTAKEIWENELEAIRNKQIAGDYVQPCSVCECYGRGKSNEVSTESTD